MAGRSRPGVRTPLRRVAVLGGGPGGLYAARLLKLARPRLEVTVHEQEAPATTFGFGVGLTDGTRRNLAAADPDTLADVLATGVAYDLVLCVDGRTARVRGDALVGVARTELLAVLARYAEKAGVRLDVGRRRRADEIDADLVVAADGVSSATREAGNFGARIDVGRGLHLWCGAGIAVPHAMFVPVRTEHGTFVAHAYPYAADRSTVVVETDEATWQRAGFAATTRATPPDATDTTSLAVLSRVFGEQLHGAALLGNRTRWTRFRTVRCARWYDGRIVLLGDAAHTAHFSIGSGTKLAMEDAIELAGALRDEPDTAAALQRYEQVRRPAVERLQTLALRSQVWWNSFPHRLDQPVEQLTLAYMTRAGNVPLPRFAAAEPAVVGAALGQYAGTSTPPAVPDELTRWILDRPLAWAGRRFPRRLLDTRERTALRLTTIDRALRDPWDDEGDAVVEEAHRARRAGADGFWLSGSPDRPSTLSRLDLAERLVRQTDGLVLVGGPETLRDDLAAGLASGRAHLISFDGEGKP